MATLLANSARHATASIDGKTVAAVRSQYASVENIAADQPAFLNGCRVEDETASVVGPNDELLFGKSSGTKGI